MSRPVTAQRTTDTHRPRLIDSPNAMLPPSFLSPPTPGSNDGPTTIAGGKRAAMRGRENAQAWPEARTIHTASAYKTSKNSRPLCLESCHQRHFSGARAFNAVICAEGEKSRSSPKQGRSQSLSVMMHWLMNRAGNRYSRRTRKSQPNSVIASRNARSIRQHWRPDLDTTKTRQRLSQL